MTVIEFAPHIVPAMDAEARTTFQRILTKQKLKFKARRGYPATPTRCSPPPGRTHVGTRSAVLCSSSAAAAVGTRESS